MAYFLGEITGELLKHLIMISMKGLRYKSIADNLITLIEEIQPTIREIEYSGVELPAHRQAQIGMLYTIIEKGKKLIEKVHSCRRWNMLQQHTLARRMEKLEKELSDFLRAPILTQILADVIRLLANSDKRSDLVDKGLEKMSEQLGSMKIGSGLELGKEVVEEWEYQYGPHRFAYNELFIATKGFKENQLLGRGGFGQVYKGMLQGSNAEIAVKRTSHDSSQGMSEFVAEISTIGRLRHPNLVRLLGYCRHKEDLYLVYDYMPNGSLDKYISRNGTQERLTWEQRFKIIKDVASALLYLHQEWVQVIIHRDIKPANVLIDHKMNARLGDFGLAKLYDHGFDPQTTIVAGTVGYIAPEFVRTGRATTSTDVYAFGVVMLELVCGRRPIERGAEKSEEVLVDWILNLWEKGEIFDAAEESIRQEVNKGQIELVLKLGVLCSHQAESIRPDMSAVMRILNGVSQLPDNLLDVLRREKLRGWQETSPMELMEVLFDVDSLGTNTFTSHGR